MAAAAQGRPDKALHAKVNAALTWTQMKTQHRLIPHMDEVLYAAAKTLWCLWHLDLAFFS